MVDHSRRQSVREENRRATGIEQNSKLTRHHPGLSIMKIKGFTRTPLSSALIVAFAGGFQALAREYR